MFHLCMCGLCIVVAALIGYDDRGVCFQDDHEEKMIVIDYFLYTDVRHWIVAQNILPLLSASNNNDQ
jgi:hypothetical protein